MQWTPRVTVAAVIEKNQRFLLVEEHTGNGLALNQPAGHWEFGESLLDAVKREALEETAHLFVPENLLGIYNWSLPDSRKTYLRFAFSGNASEQQPPQPLDEDIVRTLWLTREEIHASRSRHRSPLVWQCIQDYDAGKRYPLDILQHFDDATEQSF